LESYPKNRELWARDVAQENQSLQFEELLETQSQLEQAARLYKDLFDSSPAGYCLLDQAGLVRQFNTAARVMLEGRFQLNEGRPITLHLAPDSHLELRRKMQSLQRRPEVRQAFQASTSAGRWLEIVLTRPGGLAGGGYLLSCWDLTEIHAQELRVQRTQILLERTLDKLPITLRLVTRHFKLWPQEQDDLQQWLDIPDREYRKLQMLLRNVLDNHSALELLVLRGNDGRPLTVHVAFLQQTSPELAIALVELSEQEEAARQLVRDYTKNALQSRLKAVSLMSGKLTHQLNSFLTTIVGQVNELVKEPVEDLQVAELLEVSQRASRVCQELLTFVDHQPGGARRLDPVRALSLVADLVNESFPEPISVTVNSPAALPDVKLDGHLFLTSLQELFLESLALACTSSLELEVVLSQEGGCVVVEISGWNVSNLYELLQTPSARALEAQGIMVAHRGGRALFHLPLFGDFEPDNRAEKGGQSAVLLVEDDPNLRRLLERTLKRAGHRVVATCDGAQALSTFHEDERPFDLVITDIVMPVIDGIELVEKLRACQRGLPVLFMSGYKPDDARPLPQPSLFIAKPFLPKEFLQKVDECLVST
jgi:two-component system cell cycle response regulator CpdR